MASLRALEERIGYRFQTITLLETALTHSSFLNERVDERLHLQNNERFEFLGDALVNYVAALLVYEHDTSADEGDLTRMRAALIRTETLAELARDLGLGAYLRLGRGEDRSGARQRDAILADSFEALVAAIFLDGGLEAARSVLVVLFSEQLAWLAQSGIPLDYKTQLQQHVQALHNVTPRYRMAPDMLPGADGIYVIEVLIGEQRIGLGQGTSKQIASQQAARLALEQLGLL